MDRGCGDVVMKDRVIQALEDQVGCYRRLAKLAELQHTHVQQDQTEALMDVLKSRQVVVDQITELEIQLEPVKKNWKEFAGRVEPLLSEKRRLLEEITTADQNDALVLQQRKLNVGKQIKQAAAARQVNRNYAVAAYGNRQSRMDMQQ